MSTRDSDPTLSTSTAQGTAATPASPGIDERRAGYDAFLARELPADVRTQASILGAARPSS